MQGADGKAAGKEGGKDDKGAVVRVRLNVDAKGVSKEAEAWHDKSAVKRLEAVRLRGALLDAGLDCRLCAPACVCACLCARAACQGLAARAPAD